METYKDTLTQKPDLTIMAKNNTLEIVEAPEDMVKIKSNCTSLVNGSLYYGSYNYTVKRSRLFDRRGVSEINGVCRRNFKTILLNAAGFST
ncbi:MAG: hypothetical protein ACJ700_02830 [Nitrososphaera sp.]